MIYSIDKKILIDAIFINNGGGRVLLDYLFQELCASDKHSYTFLLDQRVYSDYSDLTKDNVTIIFLDGLAKRNSFFKNNKDVFYKVLCFGNIPPNIRTSAKVYTYFHQLLYLDLPKDMAWKRKIIYTLKQKIVNHFKGNTDFWLVQSSLVKNRLSKKYNISSDQIIELPFYPPFENQVSVEKIPNSYLFVSNAPLHKNHRRLIEAFSKFYDLHKTGELILTVSDDFQELNQLINEKQRQGYPIKNIGFVNRNELQKLYAEAEYQIFPSLSESFGLGLVEAIENGCKIIGADLPYTYAVCEPSLTFNPLDINSIVNALSLSLQPEIKTSRAKVYNQINDLMSLLK